MCWFHSEGISILSVKSSSAPYSEGLEMCVCLLKRLLKRCGIFMLAFCKFEIFCCGSIREGFLKKIVESDEMCFDRC